MANEVTNNTVSNNILTTTNDYVNMDCDHTQSHNNKISLEESLRSSLESYEEQKESGIEATRQTVILPRLWQWVKTDLFDNSTNHKAKHKVSISICKGGEIQRYRSLNNSPFVCFKRGFVDYKNDPHYNFVKSIYHQLKQQGYRPQVSKCFTKGYQGRVNDTIFGLSTILCREPQAHRYTLALVAEEQVMWVALKGDSEHLSDSQKKNRIVATGSIMQPAKPYGGIRARDILF